MLIAIHGSGRFVGPSRQAKQIEMEIRFFELEGTKRYKPPVIGVNLLGYDNIFKTTDPQRLINLRHCQLVHGNDTLLMFLPMERAAIVRFVPCLRRTPLAVLVERSVGKAVIS